jgi:membrane protease YdiL (CAAX protease family)
MELLAQSLRALTPLGLLLGAVTIGLAPGIGEETFFRGLIQTRLVARWGRWPAIVITAVGFGVFHLDLVQGGLAVVVGLYLGWLTERFGGIRPSIAAHAINNAMFVAFSSFASDDKGPRSAEITVLAVGAVAWIGCTALLRSRLAVRSA